ncbi:MAG: RluA family pseudouridine synthase [Planctomycetota bacterium]
MHDAADSPDDTVDASLGSSFILKGGKVDPHAIASAIERARKLAAQTGDDSNEPELPRVVFTLQRDLGTRLDKYLTGRITFMSRTQLQRLIEQGGATVNGKPAKPRTKLFKGDCVEVVVPPPPDKTIQPDDIPLEVMHEDEHLVVINKSPDIIVHPARSELRGTMINALAHHFASVSGGGLSGVGEEHARPGVVHRLDRQTSGCIVFAKDDEAHWKLGRQFEQRTVDKRYLAVTHGHIEPDVDVIELPLGPHPSRDKGYREKQVVRHDDLGKPATTIYRVRERYTIPDTPIGPQRFTLVELELKTGRTHQIRVHLSHLGFSIVGDDMYKGRTFVVRDTEAGKRTDRVVIDRQALHAALLAFEHPITGESMVFTAPLRPDMAELVRELRGEGVSESRVEAVHAEGTVPLARFGLA